MGEHEKILIDQRIFTNLIKTRLQPPAPPPSAVVVAEYKYFVAIQAADNRPGRLKVQKGEVTQMENGIPVSHHGIPGLNHHLVHLLHICERARLKIDNQLMPEMVVRSKKHI
ncbi:hypothetical protein D3C72_2094510 [compost metagenome]